jgi:hypothetical protein
MSSYTVKETLELPYSIGLYEYRSGITLSGSAQTLLAIKAEGMGAYGIGWKSSNALFQVQWRYRRREKPSVAIISDPSGGDVWVPWDGDLESGSASESGEEWGEWQGVDVETSEGRSPTTPPAYQGVPGIYAIDSALGAYEPYIIPLPYDVSTYDLTVLQIRARVILTFMTPKQVSNWAYGEVALAPAPQVNTITATRNADGSLTIALDTNLTRGGVLLTADGFTAGGQLVGGTAIYETSGADPTATVERWPEGKSVTIRNLAITTADGITERLGTVSIDVTDLTPTTPVPKPAISIDEAGHLTITPQSPATLVGTKWALDDVLDLLPSGTSYSINYTAEGLTDSFIELRFGTYIDNKALGYYTGSVGYYVYTEGDGWYSPTQRTITITGGNDAQNAELIAWLMANAELIEGGTAYDEVSARATYTDEEGNIYDEVVPITAQGMEWVGTIPTPPLDVEIAVVISYTVGDDWGYSVETVTVPSDGRVLFDWGADHFAIRYNPDRQMTVTPIGGTVDIQGSELPKSRYSDSRNSSMTMQGTLINPAEDSYNGDAWLPQLEILHKPHDWIMRTPNGLRRRVRVESYTPDWATQSANRIMNVTIVTQEVAG